MAFERAKKFVADNPIVGLGLGLGLILFVSVGMPILLSSLLSTLFSAAVGLLFSPIPFAVISSATLVGLQLFTPVKPFTFVWNKLVDLTNWIFSSRVHQAFDGDIDPAAVVAGAAPLAVAGDRAKVKPEGVRHVRHVRHVRFADTPEVLGDTQPDSESDVEVGKTTLAR